MKVLLSFRLKPMLLSETVVHINEQTVCLCGWSDEQNV